MKDGWIRQNRGDSNIGSSFVNGLLSEIFFPSMLSLTFFEYVMCVCAEWRISFVLYFTQLTLYYRYYQCDFFRRKEYYEIGFDTQNILFKKTISISPGEKKKNIQSLGLV